MESVGHFLEVVDQARDLLHAADDLGTVGRRGGDVMWAGAA